MKASAPAAFSLLGRQKVRLLYALRPVLEDHHFKQSLDDSLFFSGADGAKHLKDLPAELLKGWLKSIYGNGERCS